MPKRAKIDAVSPETGNLQIYTIKLVIEKRQCIYLFLRHFPPNMGLPLQHFRQVYKIDSSFYWLSCIPTMSCNHTVSLN